ncbi:MAG: GNAT family N-acetyltransferase [Bacillus sp. (in: firmicutes)]
MNDIQLLELIRLQDTCESYEDIKLKLNWDVLKTRNEEDGFDFFHFEDDRLVGFLGIYYFGEEYEMCGMVHPEFRRRGIFTELFKQALAALDDSAPVLLNAPADSLSAKGWLSTIPCSYGFSEYQMHWEKQELPENNLVNLRRATFEDLADMMALNEIGFGYELQDDEENRRELEEASVYMIEADGKTVGKIHMKTELDQSWIYGFVVYPAYQGKGYGKSALTQMVQLEEANDVYIEVATENEHALSLYKQCGFIPYQKQDYYDCH